ncbi:MAG: hypothetical protein WKG32_03430 [Gemmatimonadaceae bacterium]
MIERDLVDAGNRDLGVGVRGEQYASGRRMQLHRLADQLGARHSGHALVHQEKCDRRVAGRECLRGLEAFRRRCGGHHAIVRAILPSQVALDRSEDSEVVIDGEDDGFRHVRLLQSVPSTSERRIYARSYGPANSARTRIRLASAVASRHSFTDRSAMARVIDCIVRGTTDKTRQPTGVH